MLPGIENAVRMIHNQKDIFDSLAIRAMKGQYGWDQSAKKYIELYNTLLERRDAENAAEAKKNAE